MLKKTAACALSTHGLLKGIVVDRLNTAEEIIVLWCVRAYRLLQDANEIGAKSTYATLGKQLQFKL